MPEKFGFPIREDLWLPLNVSKSAEPGEGAPLYLVGKLNQGVSHEQAQVEINELMKPLASEFPEAYGDRRDVVVPFASINSPVTGNMPVLLRGITVIVLVLASINLSSLLFIRSHARRQEMAVRSAVGASGWGLARQILLESFLVCFFGYVISLLVTAGLLALLQTQLVHSMNHISFWFELSLDSQALLNGSVCTLFVWLSSSSFVSVRAYRCQPAVVLNEANKGSGSQGRSLSTQLVVGVEVILSCFLLVGCGAMIYMLEQVFNTDYGVDPEQYLVGTVSLSHPDYLTDQQRMIYVKDLNQTVVEVTGIDKAAVTTAPPGLIGLPGNYNLPGEDLSVNGKFPKQNTIWVSRNYFDVIGLPILEGRQFNRGDTPDSERVVIITEDFAERFSPEHSPIGKTIERIEADERQLLTVVGVIPNLLQGPTRAFVLGPSLYRPMAQQTPITFYLIAGHDAQTHPGRWPQSLRDALRDKVVTVDRNVPLEEIRTMTDLLVRLMGAAQEIGHLFIGFSLVTLILACIGIYGVISRSIYLRTHEIGVRRALGSTDAKIIARFVRQGSYFLILGILVGIVPIYIYIVEFGYIMKSVAGNLEFLKAVCLIVVLTMMALIGIASYIPARNAVAMEPGDALRYE
jgi:predicted permease